MTNVTSISDKIKDSRSSPDYKMFQEAANLRMVCYQAHIDAGFDHDSAISFTHLDTQDQIALEDQFEIVFEPDWEQDQ